MLPFAPWSWEPDHAAPQRALQARLKALVTRPRPWDQVWAPRRHPALWDLAVFMRDEAASPLAQGQEGSMWWLLPCAYL